MHYHRNILFTFVILVASFLSWFGVIHEAQAGKYLLAWSNDKGTDDGVQNPDFLAVIDADPQSDTYGHVVRTASLPCIPHANLLDELGIAPGISFCVLNEAHHMNSGDLFVDPVTGHRFLFTGGLISANIFKFDVTDPLNIPPATLVVTSRDVKNFAGTDDILPLANGHLISSYMGSKNLTTPGGLVEFSPNGASTFIAEYPAAKAGGPTRYVPSIKGVTDTGLLAHPHSLGVREDLNVLVTSDYADPISLATSTPTDQHQDLGTTVRVWNLSNLAAGPQKIIQVPDGPRVESNRIHEEPEGLMAGGLLHKDVDKGYFTASMCGGVLFYTPDITVANPVFHEVYDLGPCTGASLFDITQDDHYLVLMVSGIQSPGDPIFNRDYPGEHARRVIVLDISPLTSQRTGPILCGPPTVTNDPVTGFTTGFSGHNNGAADCPIEVSSINVDSTLNFSTHGGPHELAFDLGENRFAFDDYFVDLTNFGLPGTGSGGDLKIYIATFDKKTGKATLDTNFRDEITGEVGVNFNRPITYRWPGARGFAGSAKPHDLGFIHTDD
jgi:hypothetical protein